MKHHLSQFINVPVMLAGLLSSLAAVAQPLPDLTITNLSVSQDCQLEVAIENLGPGSLPETAFYTGTEPSLQLYRDNQPAGARNMGQRALQPAGGTYSYANAAANQVISGTYSFRAVIDKNNLVDEADENNNEMTRTLSCTPSLPDLGITKVSFMKDCQAQVTLVNTGSEPYPNNHFNGVVVFRTIDGAGKGYRKLTDIDPTGNLKTPGGTMVWTDLPDFKAMTIAKYQLGGSGLSAEQSSANNQVTATIPAEGCGATFRNVGAKQQLVPKRDKKIIIEPRPKMRKQD